jgi:predicted Zn finger-like uncharacterized protein
LDGLALLGAAPIERGQLMTMIAECPSCHARFKVEDQYAGKRARCRQCKEVFQVPAKTSTEIGDVGLEPIDDEPPPVRTAQRSSAEKPRSAVVEIVSAPKPTLPVAEDDSAGYMLADGTGKKAKAVRARPERLPGVGVSARGVRDATAATIKTLTPEQILNSFGRAIEPVKPTPLYRLWVAIVAAVMVLLPLVYIALIGLFAAALFYHAVHNVSVFQSLGGTSRGSAKAALAIYVGPLVIGGTVLVFMLKPFFARSRRGEKQRVLDPDVEPLLYAFVDGICASVGSPKPSRIEVDSNVNASARRDGPLLGLFGSDLVLTIGLPLAAGLTLKQIAGVIAHEFGHFSQGAGMRLYALIMTVNMWFARVVYERDSWDETLEQASSSGNGYITVLAMLTRLAVWLTRRILWVLMTAGHLVSAFLSRQMEFDADRYEARMVGGRVFAETSWRLRVMSLAQNGAMADLGTSWQARRLPDNFPKLVLANVPQIPKELMAAYRQSVESSKTGWLETHPCDKDRIASAAIEEPGDGIFQIDGQATDVFSNFDAMAKVVSFEFYRSMLGPEMTKEQLYSVAELVETQVGNQEGQAAAERYFLGACDLLTMRLVLPWTYPELPTDPPAAKRTLLQARSDLEAARAATIQANRQAEKAYQRLFQAESAILIINAGLKLDATAFDLKAPTTRAAEAARDKALAEIHQIEEECETFGKAAARRLTQALAIVEADQVADRIPEGRDRREEARALYTCAAHLGNAYTAATVPVARHRSALIGLLSAFQTAKRQNDENIANVVFRASAALAESLETLRWKVGDTIYYPFEHAHENITLARFVLPDSIPPKENIEGLLQLSDGALDRLRGLYARVLGRLALTAEEVERVLGLAPIEFKDSGDANVNASGDQR